MVELIKLKPKLFNKAGLLFLVALFVAIPLGVFVDAGFFILAAFLALGTILGLIFNIVGSISIEGNKFIQKTAFASEKVIPIEQIESMNVDSFAGRTGFTMKINQDYMVKNMPNAQLIGNIQIIGGNFDGKELNSFVNALMSINPNIRLNAPQTPTQPSQETPTTQSKGMLSFFHRGILEVQDSPSKPGYSELVKKINSLKKIRNAQIIFLATIFIVILVLFGLNKFFKGSPQLVAIMGLIALPLIITVICLMHFAESYKTLKIQKEYGSTFNIIMPSSAIRNFYKARGNVITITSYINMIGSIIVLVIAILFSLFLWFTRSQLSIS